MTFPQGLTTLHRWARLHKRHLSGIIGGLLCIPLVSCRATPTAPPASDIPAPSAAPSPNGSPNGINPGNAPPPPPPNSYLAQLPPEATNLLVSLNIAIAIPTYLPPAMTLANYGAGDAAEGVGGGAYYWLVYRDNNDRCFAIEYAANGIETMSLENQDPLNSGLFGEGYTLYHGNFPNGGDGELPESDLFTDWFDGEDGFYRLVGAGLINGQDYGQGDCSNITIKEAIAVAESLSYLPTDIRTLELVTPKAEDTK